MRRAARQRLFGKEATLVLGLSITACSGDAVDADNRVMPAATTSVQEPPAVSPQQPGLQADVAPMEPDATSAVSREPDAPTGCLWETQDLLSRIDAQSPALIDCGLFLEEQPLENECFTNGLHGSDSVQITINNCIDCMIHSTYVSTSSGLKVHLFREADYYGDDVRVVRVDSCTDFVPGQGPGANCAAPATLYSCSDPLPDPSSL